MRLKSNENLRGDINQGIVLLTRFKQKSDGIQLCFMQIFGNKVVSSGVKRHRHGIPLGQVSISVSIQKKPKTYPAARFSRGTQIIKNA
jgi:hypothetical protein